MKFNDLTLTIKKNKIRPGRGISAGRGKTAGRGTKGQNARTGKKLRAGFEGGQNSLMTRVPKLKGFKSKRTKAQIVYTGNLQLVNGKNINNQTLFADGLIGSEFQAVKIISRGEIKGAYKVSVQAISASAKAAIEKAGGSVEVSETPKRQATKKD
jgi:large subunit ribosomal protein L15